MSSDPDFIDGDPDGRCNGGNPPLGDTSVPGTGLGLWILGFGAGISPDPGFIPGAPDGRCNRGDPPIGYTFVPGIGLGL